ncbi:MAG TPA: TonB-dependent receptor [Gammaproteobacteria bacterium]|nr:TonB-dependent receptor [Gammaproteobacteria bacterium]
MPVFCERTFIVLLFLSTEIPVVSADDIFELDGIVITGTRTEKPVLESPVRTEVVTRKEIEKIHARDLKEALEDVPGLMLKPNQKNGFVAWLQGMDANRVLVVINGEPVSPSTGSSVDLTQIGTMDIARIEIVKGATSALYGSNAMGGIINIITRKPTKPLSYQLSVDGGSYGNKNLSGNANEINARRLAANLAIKRSIGYWQLNADLRDKDGYTLDPDSFRAEGSEGAKANINLRTAWTPDETTEIYIAPRYYREDISNNITTFTPGVGDIKKKKNEAARRASITVGAARQFKSGGRLRGWLFSENWQNITQQDVISTPQVDQQRTAEIDLYRAELQRDEPVGENHVLTSGLVLRKETLNQYTTVPNQTTPPEVDNKEKETMEAYFQDDILVNEQWELVPGIRVQNDSRFGFYAAPKVNAMYTPDWIPGVVTNVRMGIGRGYRSPDLKEQYFVFDHSQLGYMVLGNSNLQPETSDSYQLGIEFARQDDFRADITLFHNRIKNLIDTRINPEKSAQEGLNILEYANFSRALTQGVELSGNLYWNALNLKGGYTLLDSEDRITGKTLRNRPRHLLKAGVDYEYKPWGTMVTLRGVYQSQEFYDADNLLNSPAWTTWDLKMTQSITSGIRIFAGIDNLTDEHRDPGIYYDNRPEAGRFVYVGLKVKN